MSGIRSTGTGPEERLFALVERAVDGRWRIERNVRSLPGTPDVLIPDLQVVIFADGCFFHSCPIHGHVPRSNIDYWEPKLERTVRRDRRNRRKLRAMGYAVWRLWEHDLKPSRCDRAGMMLARRIEQRALRAVVAR